MKLFVLMRQIIKKNLFALLIANLIMTIALALFTYMIASINTYLKPLKLFQTHFLKSDYFYSLDPISNENEEAFISMLESIRERDYVETVLYDHSVILFENEQLLSIKVLDAEKANVFIPGMLYGKICKPCKDTNEPIEFIVPESFEKMYKKGKITFLSSAINDDSYPFICTGISAEPTYYFSLNYFSEQMTAADFIIGKSPTLFMRDSEESNVLFDDNDFVDYNTFLVVYSSNITDNQRDELVSELTGYLHISSEQIMHNSKESMNKAKDKLLFPTILLFLTVFAFFDVLFLIIQGKKYDLSIYMFLGLSKQKMYGFVFLLVCLAALFPLVLNTFFVLCYKFFVTFGILSFENTMYENWFVLLLIILYFIISGVIGGIHILSLSNISPIENIRRSLR